MTNSNLKQSIEGLEQLRDELRVKAHLFKADLKDEWQKAEKNWQRLNGELSPTKLAAKQSAEEVKEATVRLFDTAKRAYERIKQTLPS
jgi:ribosomal protein L32E